MTMKAKLALATQMSGENVPRDALTQTSKRMVGERE